MGFSTCDMHGSFIFPFFIYIFKDFLRIDLNVRRKLTTLVANTILACNVKYYLKQIIGYVQ